MRHTSYKGFPRIRIYALAKAFNFKPRYTDDGLSLNNSPFCDYLHLIYPTELEIKDATDSQFSTVCFLPWPSTWNRQRRKIKTKLYNKRDDCNFTSTSLSLVTIFQRHQSMEFTVHNSYVILRLGSSTFIFWTELRCWLKSYSSKDALLLGWRHRYINSTVAMASQTC